MSENVAEVVAADVVEMQESATSTSQEVAALSAPDEEEASVNDGAGTTEETFPRATVEKLRRENAKYRARAKRTDELAQRLQNALVALDGRLADPEDLPFNEDFLEDPDALKAAIDQLVEHKPGLRAVRPVGDVGQGKRGNSAGDSTNLLQIIRGY